VGEEGGARGTGCLFSSTIEEVGFEMSQSLHPHGSSIPILIFCSRLKIRISAMSWGFGVMLSVLVENSPFPALVIREIEIRNWWSFKR